MIEFIKSQLRQGKRIPYNYQEYGAIAVEEMFMDRDPIGRSRSRRGKDMTAPMKGDLQEYEVHLTKIHNSRNM